jgi:hypothetical protein
VNASVAIAPASVVLVPGQLTFGQFCDDWLRRQVVEPPPSGPVVMPSGLFGPWVPGLTEPDRRASLRALAMLCAVFCGSSDPVVAALRKAELKPDTADQARALFDKLPTLRRRQVLATYARVMRPRT